MILAPFIVQAGPREHHGLLHRCGGLVIVVLYHLLSGRLHHVAEAAIRLELWLHFLIIVILQGEALDTQLPQQVVLLGDLLAMLHRRV